MNIIAATDLIYQNFILNWADRTPFHFDNEKTETSPPSEAYCFVQVEFLTSNQLTQMPVGSRKFDRLGALIVVLHVPLLIGVNAMNGHLDKLVTDWEQVRLDDELWFNDVTIQSLPIKDDGAYKKIFQAGFVVTQIR